MTWRQRVRTDADGLAEYIPPADLVLDCISGTWASGAAGLVTISVDGHAEAVVSPDRAGMFVRRELPRVCVPARARLTVELPGTGLVELKGHLR